MIPIDWRANGLVDALAKGGAAFHDLAQPAAALINSASQLSQHALVQLARVTHAANDHQVVRIDKQEVPHMWYAI